MIDPNVSLNFAGTVTTCHIELLSVVVSIPKHADMLDFSLRTSAILANFLRSIFSKQTNSA